MDLDPKGRSRRGEGVEDVFREGETRKEQQQEGDEHQQSSVSFYLEKEIEEPLSFPFLSL